MTKENIVSPDSVITANEMFSEVESAVQEVVEMVKQITSTVQEQVERGEELQRKVKEAMEQNQKTPLLEGTVGELISLSILNQALSLKSGYELREQYESLLMPTLQEQLLMKQEAITPLQAQELGIQRQLIKVQSEPPITIEQLDLPTIELLYTDFQTMCALELQLERLYPNQCPTIRQQLTVMCEQRVSRLHILQGYEALQKQMIQMYVPYFSCFPYSLNILAMRITAATISALLNKTMTLYALGAQQQQMTACKYMLMPCENRTLQTKVVASGKTLNEAVPSKFSLKATENLDDEEEVPLGTDYTGHPFFWMTLRYAYSMPYYIRRILAIMTGMPENYRYGLYFGIGGLPSRHSTWKQRWLGAPEAKYLHYSVDTDVMNLIHKYQSKRGFFYMRYGQYYKKKRV